MKQILLFIIILAPLLLKAQSSKISDSSTSLPKHLAEVLFKKDKSAHFVIRCYATINTKDTSAEPLVILNNFPFKGSFKDLNLPASEIKSITVIKDAAAASIWGAQARNGVIVVETIKKVSKRATIKKTTKVKLTATATPRTSNTLTIGPNPAKTMFRIYGTNNTRPFTLSLVNMQGQVLRTWTNVNVPGKQHEFDITGITPGTYIATIKTKAGISSGKILVTR